MILNNGMFFFFFKWVNSSDSSTTCDWLETKIRKRKYYYYYLIIFITIVIMHSNMFNWLTLQRRHHCAGKKWLLEVISSSLVHSLHLSLSLSAADIKVFSRKKKSPKEDKFPWPCLAPVRLCQNDSLDSIHTTESNLSKFPEKTSFYFGPQSAATTAYWCPSFVSFSCCERVRGEMLTF